MKIRLKKQAFLLLMCILIAVSLVACKPVENEEGTPQNNQMAADLLPEPSNSLVLYDFPYSGNENLIKKAIEIFEREYPHVEVELRMGKVLDADEISEAFELPDGPDVAMLPAGSPWVARMTEKGLFEDLYPFLLWNEELILSEYNEAAMEMGLYQGVLYALPISFQSQVWLTTQEILNEAGIMLNPGETLLIGDALRLMETYATENPENPLIRDAWTGQMLSRFFPWCSLELADYEKKSVTVDSDELRVYADFYKDYMYEHDVVNPPADYPIFGLPLENRECLFMHFSTSQELIGAYSGLITAGETPILLNCPSVNGESVGSPALFVQVRKDCPNKENAYNFLKILFSEEIQTEINELSSHDCIPVLRSSMEATIRNLLEGIYAPGKSMYSGKVEFSELTHDDIDIIMETMFEVDLCVLDNSMGYTISKAMRPYFEDEDSYENCFGQFVMDATALMGE